MSCLGNKPRSFCHFWDCTQVLHFGLLLTMRATPFLLWFLPPVVDIWSSGLNWPTPVHFSSLIPKMLMFILTISCLTTSNLPWFMDLTFQVPMQYCSLQHQILLLSPDTSTTECRFSFGLTASFFLGLWVVLLHSSPVAYWTSSDLWTHLSVSYLFVLLCSSWGSHGKYTGVVYHSLLQYSRSYFVKTLCYDP